jgi:L-fuculose-phosphate aldolase
MNLDPREDLVRHYRWLRQFGINDSHSGNGSVRTDSAIWLTPTGACADALGAGDLIACPIDGPPAQGASLDAPLHLEVYRRNPLANAELHGHGPYTVALTMDGRDFVPADFEGQLYFPKVPVIQIPYRDYVQSSPARIAELLASHPIAVVAGHGAYACAPTLNLAYKWVCSLEHSAKTAFLAARAGTL